LNGGSSSLKFALFDHDPDERVPNRLPTSTLRGKIVRIGLPGCSATITPANGSNSEKTDIPCPDLDAAAHWLIDHLWKTSPHQSIAAVIHRVVHGGPHYHEPQQVSAPLLTELRRISFLDPDHLPGEIALIERFQSGLPDARHFVCFDTAFHHDMPRVAQQIPIPREYESLGIRRYGFHGLSYAYILDHLARTISPEAAGGRLIIAHLGAGASMAAVRDGHSIDTTMGLTPTSGLVMATRTGDIDPSLPAFFSHTKGMSENQFQDMVNHRSGLLGVSETTPDFRDLLTREPTDPRAAEALALFVYHARRMIGSLAAALGGLETLIFSGGIGENSPEARQRICQGLEFLGIRLDPGRNQAANPLISPDNTPVAVRVIPTDEESMMARSAAMLLA
jgi:acetate kinase